MAGPMRHPTDEMGYCASQVRVDQGLSKGSYLVIVCYIFCAVKTCYVFSCLLFLVEFVVFGHVCLIDNVFGFYYGGGVTFTELSQLTLVRFLFLDSIANEEHLLEE